jgi:hypothetical protein
MPVRAFAFNKNTTGKGANKKKSAKAERNKGVNPADVEDDRNVEDPDDMDDKQMALIIDILKPYKVPKRKLTPEQFARDQEIAKTYTRMMQRIHNHHGRNLQRLIRLKWEAINALPPDLQKAALVLDETPWPLSRLPPTWTPPIKGFSTKPKEQQEE